LLFVIRIIWMLASEIDLKNLSNPRNP